MRSQKFPRRPFPKREPTTSGTRIAVTCGLGVLVFVCLTADGLDIDVPNAAFVPDRFQLMTEKDRLVRKCRVVWIQQYRIGVAFES
jgi:hypothetical protein